MICTATIRLFTCVNDNVLITQLSAGRAIWPDLRRCMTWMRPMYWVDPLTPVACELQAGWCHFLPYYADILFSPWLKLINNLQSQSPSSDVFTPRSFLQSISQRSDQSMQNICQWMDDVTAASAGSLELFGGQKSIFVADACHCHFPDSGRMNAVWPKWLCFRENAVS